MLFTECCSTLNNFSIKQKMCLQKQDWIILLGMVVS